MNAVSLILATFLAGTIERVEMMAILVGVGATRSWRSTLIGAAAGFAFLAGLTITLGSALLTIPIQALRLAVGSLLLILGLQWLKKALLRIARPSARRSAPAEFSPASPEKIDWYALVDAGGNSAGALLLALGLAIR